MFFLVGITEVGYLALALAVGGGILRFVAFGVCTQTVSSSDEKS